MPLHLAGSLHSPSRVSAQVSALGSEMKNSFKYVVFGIKPNARTYLREIYMN